MLKIGWISDPKAPSAFWDSVLLLFSLFAVEGIYFGLNPP